MLREALEFVYFTSYKISLRHFAANRFRKSWAFVNWSKMVYIVNIGVSDLVLSRFSLP